MARKKTEVTVRSTMPIEKEGDTSNIIPYISQQEREVISKPNCKLCQSEFREEAEVEYEKTYKYAALVTWLRNTKGVEISYPAVRNHIIHHMRIPEKRQYLFEYAEDVKKWSEGQKDRAGAITNIISILTKELTEIAAEGQAMNVQDRCKNAETIKKLSDSILLYQDKKAQYEKSLEPAVLIITQLKVIISDEMEHNTSMEAKRILIKVLQRLQDSVGDMVVVDNS